MKFKLMLFLFINTLLHCYVAHAWVADTITIKKHSVPLPPKSPEQVARLFKPWYSDCRFTNKYTVQKRLQKYPFSRAATILAITFHSSDAPAPSKDDSLAKRFMLPQNVLLRGGFSIRADTLDRSTILECKTLDKGQVNKLTNIIFNVDFKHHGHNLVGGASCYEPRNALIFIDQKGKVYDYLAICFACEHYSSKRDKIDVGTECTQKYELLRRYFKSIGIRFGTKPHMTFEDDWAFKL